MKKPPTILLVDDDPQDRMLIEDAFRESAFAGQVRSVGDADEMYVYLGGDPKNATESTPALILLDLNLPKKDGRQILKELKADTKLRPIPVVVLTTSGASDDVRYSYDNGASTFIQKPESFGRLVDVVKSLRAYWFETARLPQPEEA